MTTMIDLNAEFDAAVSNLTMAHINELAEAGISYKSILRAGHVGVRRIADDGDLYRPDPDGFAAVILAAWFEGPPSIYRAVEHPEIVDLIAWQIADPTRWWRRVWGPPPVLGEDTYLNAVVAGEPIRLFSSPHEWLRANCDGAVFLQDAAMRWAAEESEHRSAA